MIKWFLICLIFLGSINIEQPFDRNFQLVSQCLSIIEPSDNSMLLFEEPLEIWFSERAEAPIFILKNFGIDIRENNSQQSIFVSKNCKNQNCLIINNSEVDSITAINKYLSQRAIQGDKMVDPNSYKYYFRVTNPIFITKTHFVIQTYRMRAWNIGAGCTYLFELKKGKVTLVREFDCTTG